VESTRRGYIRITKRGSDVLARSPARIDTKYLRQFDEFNKFHATKPKTVVPEPSESTPEESIEAAVQSLTDTLGVELLAQLKQVTATQFEHIVLDLLLALGYGGSRSDAAKAIGKAGDEGIDGFIREDRLGLDTVYVQAKCWQGSVSRPTVQGFVGALTGKGNKGVMITTSSFTSEAKSYAQGISSPKIILIDGPELARLMIEHNVGINTVRTYAVKKLDADYFMS
jgi:restriction system protein